MQIGGKHRIRVVIAAREPVRLGEQKVNADNSRRRGYRDQAGELIGATATVRHDELTRRRYQ
jgi:hypothetical protein